MRSALLWLLLVPAATAFPLWVRLLADTHQLTAALCSAAIGAVALLATGVIALSQLDRGQARIVRDALRAYAAPRGRVRREVLRAMSPQLRKMVAAATGLRTELRRGRARSDRALWEWLDAFDALTPYEHDGLVSAGMGSDLTTARLRSAWSGTTRLPGVPMLVAEWIAKDRVLADFVQASVAFVTRSRSPRS